MFVVNGEDCVEHCMYQALKGEVKNKERLKILYAEADVLYRKFLELIIC